MNLGIIILAAGMSKRFKSEIPKVLHKLADKSMIEIVIDNVKKLNNVKKIVIVVGYKKELVIEKLKNYKNITFAYQKEQKGTGHAVLCTDYEFNNFNGDILILCGDMPLVKYETLKKFVDFYYKNNCKLALLTTEFENPTGYGRIVKENGKFLKIVEEKDADKEIKMIKEINTGIYIVKSQILFSLLKEVSNNNAQNEYYLTDIVEIANKKGIDVDIFKSENSYQFLGINNRIQLAEAEKILIKEKINELMLNGVTFIYPETSYIGLNVKIGKDSVISQNNVITGNTEIGDRCFIGPNNVIKDTKVKNEVNIKGFCYIEKADIGKNSQIGPFSHLRPDSIIGEECKVGNFVEMKKSKLQKGVKASHLSYIGDAEVGENTNIGAGTITCNYDGINKHKTVIGKNVFIGSDTQLVAPVKIEDYVLIAAGSTITKNVTENSLVHTRVKQQEVKGKGMKAKLCKKG